MAASSRNNGDFAAKAIAARLEELRGTRPSLAFAAGRSAKGRQTVVSILKAARIVFMREGHSNLTMRMVADEAGIAVGNVSYYFPTRKELIAAMLREEMVDYAEEHLKLFDSDFESPMDILLNTVEFYVTKARTSYRFFFETWAYAGSNDAARTSVSELYRSIGQFIYQLVKAARPGLDHARITKIVLQISSLVQGLGLFIAIGPEGNPALQAAEADMRVLVKRIVETG